MPGPLLLQAQGKVVLVAGAAGGIGHATVQLFRQSGAQVAAFDCSAAQGDLVLEGDATREGDVTCAVQRTLDCFGRLDYVVNAVGVTGVGTLAEQTAQDWQRIVDINLNSAFLLTRAAFPHLTRQHGAVVLMGSTNGRNGGSALSGPAYAVAKAAIENLTRYLAKEWAPLGMRVNCVAPGPVATPMLDRLDAQAHSALREAIPLKRYASAEEVAGAIAFLCSAYAASITGTILNISGGLLLD